MWGEPQQTGNRTLHGSGLTGEGTGPAAGGNPTPREALRTAEAQSGSGEAGSGAAACPTQRSLGPAPVLSVLYTEPVEGPYKQPWRMPKTHSLRQPLLSTEHQRKIPEALGWLNSLPNPGVAEESGHPLRREGANPAVAVPRRPAESLSPASSWQTASAGRARLRLHVGRAHREEADTLQGPVFPRTASVMRWAPDVPDCIVRLSDAMLRTPGAGGTWCGLVSVWQAGCEPALRQQGALRRPGQ